MKLTLHSLADCLIKAQGGWWWEGMEGRGSGMEDGRGEVGFSGLLQLKWAGAYRLCSKGARDEGDGVEGQ